MIGKQNAFCDVTSQVVEVLVDRKKKAGAKEATLLPLKCSCSASCPRTTFCKFVNPLTTRVPLRYDLSEGGSVASRAS